VIAESRLERVKAWIESELASVTWTGKNGESVQPYLVEFVMRNYNGMEYLEIFVDTDDGITIDQCTSVSRKLSEQIDENPGIAELLPSALRLDVSSPGTSRPLRLERQYAKNIGRKLRVKYKDDSGTYQVVIGRLIAAVFGESLTLDMDTKKKKKPDEPPNHLVLRFAQIVECKVEIEF
jgi:ribosome maturation factor RimP